MTKTQERLARLWAEKAKAAAPQMNYLPESIAAYEFILANTKPETMAGVEWVHSEHHLAGADWDGVPVVMIDPDSGSTTKVMDLNEETIYSAEDNDLSPNGKRYELREVGADMPARSYYVQTSHCERPTKDLHWETVDRDGMCREDYMEWKPCVWAWGTSARTGLCEARM